MHLLEQQIQIFCALILFWRTSLTRVLVFNTCPEMNPKLSARYVYENSTDVFIDGKSIKSTAELVGMHYVL